jgi:ABC-type nitrate/sulfonate/bicarbonate transport system substrate-binding protein
MGCSKTAPKEARVRIGVSTLRISLPVFVALERGLFTKRGLVMDVHRFDTAQPLADELAAGRIDAGGYVAFPILFPPNAPPPRIRVLTAIVEDAAHPISYLLVKKGSGLRGTSSLRGKRVGILPTIAYKEWLEEILRHDHIALTEVTVEPIAPALEIDALANGGVDALFTGDPMATAALVRGVAEPLTDSPDVPRVLGDPFPFGTFAVTEELATQRAAELRAIREALDEAIGMIEADPAIGRAAMSPYVRETERPFIEKYPPARYLRSTEVSTALLDRALLLAGATRRGAAIAAP